MSHSRRSIDGEPSTIHSAIALPAPPAWAIQTASAAQNPRTSSDSPRTGMASGVNENMPLNPSTSSAPSRAGMNSSAERRAGAKSEAVKAIAAGITPGSPCPTMSSGSTGRGSWSAEPIP